jgi:hypothetical protein
MRDIKFKIWDKKEGEMKELTHNVTLEFDDSCYLIRSWELYDNKIVGHSDRFLPIQYINRLDKNGKEIYESDILKTELFNPSCGNNKEIFIGEVRFNRANSEWRVCNEMGYVLLGYNKFEKLGNKYTNPELMKYER